MQEVGGVGEASSINTCAGLCIKGGLLEGWLFLEGWSWKAGGRGGGTEALHPALSPDRPQAPCLWRLLTS